MRVTPLFLVRSIQGGGAKTVRSTQMVGTKVLLNCTQTSIFTFKRSKPETNVTYKFKELNFGIYEILQASTTQLTFAGMSVQVHAT